MLTTLLFLAAFCNDGVTYTADINCDILTRLGFLTSLSKERNLLVEFVTRFLVIFVSFELARFLFTLPQT